MKNKNKDDEYNHQKENVQLIAKGSSVTPTKSAFEAIGISLGIVVLVIVIFFVYMHFADKRRKREQQLEWEKK